MALGTLEKEILSLAQQLGEELTANNYKEAYTTAGALHSKMKGEAVIQLPIDKIEAIRAQLRFYYKHNETLNGVSKKLYGTGKKLLELVG